ncbi:conserved hypothetical protein [Ricinus communis]|uniref:Uncharacterized protein n=1 Tax=Ricinus communis TaxID=3988 RepID=B9TK27_RICCO|nr:conserved hypothetical protein [Ricinus communis]
MPPQPIWRRTPRSSSAWWLRRPLTDSLDSRASRDERAACRSPGRSAARGAWAGGGRARRSQASV